MSLPAQLEHIATWPQAAVAIVGLIMTGLVFIAIAVALSGSRFPWEKPSKDE